jgi:RTX calcium-binding nonapeptide repeat (4 copies)
MAYTINQSTMLGTGSSLTLNGSTFPVGVQGSASALKSVGSGLPSGVTVSGNAVTVKQAGAVLSDYDFRGYSISVQADNVTIKNSLFNAVSYHTIGQAANATGLKVLGNTFDGQKANGTINGDMVMSENAATISNNEFINLPADAINTAGGLIERNYFSGASYQSGAHADAISVHRTVQPLTIRENYIDFVKPADAAQGTNAALKIVSHFGTINDVTMDHNVAIGGGFNAYVGQDKYAVSNVKLTNNLMGLSEYGDKEGQFLMPGNHGSGFTMTGNSLFSAAANTQWGGSSETAPVVSKPVPSSPATSAPGTSAPDTTPIKAAPIPADHAPATPTSDWSMSAATFTGTERQDGYTGTAGNDVIYLKGGVDVVTAGGGNDVISGGTGMDWLAGQGGNDTFVYAALNESLPGAGKRDIICDWGKLNGVGNDKIDLHLIDADSSAAGDQGFIWIGSNPFSGKAGELRAYVDGKDTVVEATVNNDKVADIQIQLGGHAALHAADFVV